MDKRADSYRFYIKSLSFKGMDEPIEPSKITVIIGPNNAGKSQVLRDIRSIVLGHPQGMSGNQDGMRTVVLSDAKLNLPATLDDLEEGYSLSKHIVHMQNGFCVKETCGIGPRFDQSGYMQRQSSRANFVGYNSSWRTVVEEAMAGIASGDVDARDNLLRFLGPIFIDYSGTDERLLLTIGDRATGVLSNDYNSLSAVLDTDPDCTSFSDNVRELFGKDIVLDCMTNRAVVVPRVLDDFTEYRNTKSAELKNSILLRSSLLSEEGDGLRGFASVFLTLAASEKPVMLLDEPEAFLHPPHAYRMGEMLAKRLLSDHSREQCFITTHSSYLLRGLLRETSNEDVSIVRLTRDSDTTTAHLVDSEQISKIMNRSDFSPQYVDALFSEEAVLVEGPRDAAIYSALSEKFSVGLGNLFIPANGKQSFAPLFGFYCKTGLSCKAIADYDMLRTEDVLRQLMHSAGVQNTKANEIVTLCRNLRDCYSRLANKDTSIPTNDEERRKAALKKKYKSEVKSEIPSNLLLKVEAALHYLDDVGIHVLGSGELETLFPELGYAPHSNEWFYEALQHIRASSTDELQRDREVSRLTGFLSAL